jgi:hypothetical protein
LREVIPERKLVFTWEWASTPEHASLVTVDLRSIAGGCIPISSTSSGPIVGTLAIASSISSLDASSERNCSNLVSASARRLAETDALAVCCRLHRIIGKSLDNEARA